MEQQTKRPYRRADETRKHVLDVAARLFYADGIRAVGIDGLAAEAHVTTATLYRVFGSKEGLVAAYLRRADQEWFDWFERTVSAKGLAAIFDELDEKARRAEYRGCAFRMALAEYPSADSEVHRMAIENKLRTQERFRDLLAASCSADPDAISAQLMIVVDGICASGPERAPGSPPGAGPALARALLGTASLAAIR